VKSYENDELRRRLAGHDSEWEAEKLGEMAAVEDYRYWADRKKESIENNNSCIPDDDESHKKDTEWSLVDQDGRRAFGREPKAILPERGLVESQYAWPGPPRNQGVDHLGGSEESDPEERIWDSTFNMYVVPDTDEEEGSQEGEAEIPGEGLRDLESIDQPGDKSSGCIAGSRGLLKEDCSEEEALSGTTDSLPVIRVTRRRDQKGLIPPLEFYPGSVQELGGKKRKDPLSTKLILFKIIINS